MEQKKYHPSRTDDLFLYFLETHSIRFSTDELNEVIDIAVKSDKIEVVEEPVKEESEPTEHDKLLDQAEVAFSIAGFKFERKDLDMIVSMQELVSEFGDKLDLRTITRAKFEVEERYKAN